MSAPAFCSAAALRPALPCAAGPLRGATCARRVRVARGGARACAARSGAEEGAAGAGAGQGVLDEEGLEALVARVWEEGRTQFIGSPWAQDDYEPTPAGPLGGSGVEVGDGMAFFRAREGTWDSWRVTHHLAFKRSESGSSRISMECLEGGDERIVGLLRDNGIDEGAAVGGCYVTWKATMAWDQEGENHEGSTVFALVPDEGNERAGRIIRDRGYAEIVPIAGRYLLDKEGALCLDTPYDGGAVEERFFFDGPDVVHRVSTVRRFGGLSNATFATETRLTHADGSPAAAADDTELTDAEMELITSGRIFLNAGAREEERGAAATQGGFLSGSVARMSAAANAARAGEGKPSPGSAFGGGFSGGGKPPAPEADAAAAEDTVSEAERNAGIDLSKIPPSMRGDFARSLGIEDEEK